MTAPTSIRLPPTPKVEIEFTAGVWTDVTADVDQADDGSPVATRFGRSSEFSAPQPATLDVTLRNDTGKYTPQNQASPYWPNVQPRKRIRYSYTTVTAQRMRFLGYVKQWQPLMAGGWRPMMQISAADRMDQLSRVLMRSPIAQEITIDEPALWWPLGDAAGSTAALEQSGNVVPALNVTGAGPALTFGDNGPGFGDGPGVKFAPASSSSGQYLTAARAVTILRNFTAEFWFNIAAAPSFTPVMVTIDNPTVGVPIQIGLDTGRHVTVLSEAATITSSTVASVNGWHHVVLTRDTSHNYVLYVDGANVGSAAGFGTSGMQWTSVVVGQVAAGFVSGLFTGNIGQVAIYSAVGLVPLSTTRITAHYQAGLGYYGDTTDARIARWLGYAGLTGTDWTLDVGQVTVNTYPQDGKDVLSAAQDIAGTEGGGAAFYVTAAGSARFVNRRYRDKLIPKLTLDAVADLDPSTYQPSFDDLTLTNQVTAERSGESGSLSSQTFTNAASVTQFGISSDSATTYTTTDQDAVNLAQYEVASQATPALRFPQIAVDLATAGHDLYDAVGQLIIGDRIRLTNIPAAAYPKTTVDLFLEGWAEAADLDSYRVVFDVTAADNPARMIWNDTTYGRWQGDGQTLNAALTAAATTVVIATAGGKPTFTTAGASYPLFIQVGEEVILLNTAPGGATSPQTFTGVSRGQQGTTAAAQLTGSPVTLWQLNTWGL